MGNLPNAEMSPRIVNGVIRWYQGDTFDIQIELNLTDQDDDPITINAEDTVNISFYDGREILVKEFIFTGVTNNMVEMVFDTECTSLFHKGKYTYTVTVTHGDRTTIASENKVVVE